jgi:hypothetical protein
MPPSSSARCGVIDAELVCDSGHNRLRLAALLAERGIDLVVLKQGIDTATVAGRFTFHVLAAMDEMLADLISEGTKEGLASARARGRVGGRKPKLSAQQAEVARSMYAETGSDGKRRYTVDEIAGTFAVSRKTIYRHLDKNDAQRQPDKSTRPRPVTRPRDTGATFPGITPAAAGTAVAQARPQRQRSGLTPAALACPACGHQPASRPEALRQREDLAIVWLHQDSPSGPISQHRHTDGNSNPNRCVRPTAIAPRTDSGSCTNPRHSPYRHATLSMLALAFLQVCASKGAPAAVDNFPGHACGMITMAATT